MARKPKMDPLRGVNSTDKSVQPSDSEKMEQELRSFMELLSKDSNGFKPNEAYKVISKYIDEYKRVLYSAISDYMFVLLKENKNDRRYGSISTNIDSLLKYSKDPDSLNKDAIPPDNRTQNSVIILKIWDHINLASKQYYSLWETDDEYDERFKVRIQEFQNRIMSEMTGHLLTLVGIFTALAFLIFGSITSLESILDNLNNTSLLKVMVSGCIWGLCILNLLFVFLFCVKKISKPDNRPIQKIKETLFQRYSIVCWSNFVMIALMLIFGWAYLVRQCSLGGFIACIFNKHPTISFFVGTGLLLLVIISGMVFFIKRTKK